jgi:tRNA 2-thiouridine synthesizing protein D
VLEIERLGGKNMVSIGIILTEGPFQTEKWETAANIAKAALDKGHSVEIFLFMDGVYNALAGQAFPEREKQPMDSFREILEKGGKIVACGVCTNARGLEGGKNFIKGAKVGGLPDLSEMIDKADRLITL